MKKLTFGIILLVFYISKLFPADFFPLFPYYDPQQPQYYYQMADTCHFNLFIAQDTLWRYGKDSVKYNMPFLAAADTHNVHIVMANNIYAWKYSTYSGTWSGATSNCHANYLSFRRNRLRFLRMGPGSL